MLRGHDPQPALRRRATATRGASCARAAAVAQYYERLGLDGVDVDDVYLGNGVSELILMTLQALLDDGDEVLIPAPDYPLWTAAVTPVPAARRCTTCCDEEAGWLPDLARHRAAKITPRTKALVVINPNNPTGAVYPRALLEGLVELARRHELVLLLATRSTTRSSTTTPSTSATAALAPDVLCLTFNGLSKAYRVAGFRSGWLVVIGPEEHAQQLPGGPRHPGQHAAVRQRAGPARDPGRARRPPSHPRPGAARRAPARAARPRVGAPERDPRRVAA